MNCALRSWYIYSQIAGGTTLTWSQKEKINLANDSREGLWEECDWQNLDADLHYWTRPLRPVQVQIRCAFAESVL